MYHSSGNYEAFARPRKPTGVDEKSAYIVGAGLAGLSAAAFLIRNGQMDGKRITIFEAAKLPGGALDGVLVCPRCGPRRTLGVMTEAGQTIASLLRVEDRCSRFSARQTATSCSP